MVYLKETGQIHCGARDIDTTLSCVVFRQFDSIFVLFVSIYTILSLMHRRAYVFLGSASGNNWY